MFGCCYYTTVVRFHPFHVVIVLFKSLLSLPVCTAVNIRPAVNIRVS